MNHDERPRALRADDSPSPGVVERPLGAIEQEQVTPRALASPPPRSKPARARLLFALCAVAALVTGAAFAVSSLRPARDARPLADGLPTYSLTLAVGADVEGIEPTPNPDLTGRASATMTILLRPSTPMASAVAAHAFVVRGGVVTESRAKLDVASNGAVKVRGTIGELVGPTVGDAELDVVVQRAGDAKPARELAHLATATSGVYVAKVAVHVLP